jgi:hypothetical protein
MVDLNAVFLYRAGQQPAKMESYDYFMLGVEYASARCVEVARHNGAQSTAAKIREEFMLNQCNDCGGIIDAHVELCSACRRKLRLSERERP